MDSMSNRDKFTPQNPARLARLARVSALASPGNVRARWTADMLDSMSAHERVCWAKSLASVTIDYPDTLPSLDPFQRRKTD
jgi:hypothetical protein